MKQLDIRKEIATRKYHKTKKIFYMIYRYVMKIVGKKYNATFTKIDDINKCKGPCFVIFNHLSRIDHFYTNEITYPKRVNMLAGYSEFFRSHLHFAFKHNNVLPKKNYATDFVGTKAMLSIVKQGGSISFAPEGLASNDGMAKPIVPNTGAMLKKFGIPVYFVELRGQYLQNTKVCLDVRRGKTFAKISLLFSADDLKRLSGEEIDDIINDHIYHDEYKWQKEQHIKWETNGRICENLDDLLYRCPKCGSEFKMEAKDNYIKCTHCGNGATMDDYYDFHPFDDTCVIPDIVSDWVNQERIDIIKKIRKDDNFSYSVKVKLGMLPNDHYIKDKKLSEIVSGGTITIDHSGMHYRDDNDEKYNFDLDYKLLFTTFTELDSSSMDVYVNGEFYDFYPEQKSVIYMNMLVEEMHRLHVNYYKNFKQNAYMYENLDD